MSKKSRVVIVDENQPRIASFLQQLPAASSSALGHLNGKDTTAANVTSSGQLKSAIHSLSVGPSPPLSEQITPHGTANSSEAHKQNSNSPATLDIGSFYFVSCISRHFFLVFA
jgi:hypothetical protein